MHYQLVPFIGVGTREDPFRGTDQPDHAIIDLRPDSTVLAGRCLLVTLQREQRAGVVYLGDDLDENSVANRNGIASRLGLTFRTATPNLRRLVWELLVEHGRQDQTRWNPLRPGRDGIGRAYLGELLREERLGPLRLASITITESFNKANSDILGPDLTWTETAGDIDIVSNQARTTGLGDSIARAGTPMDTDDHYAQAVVGASEETVDTFVGVMVRRHSGATVTQYEAEACFNQNLLRQAKRVASAYTVLADTAGVVFTVGTTYLIKQIVDGSTLSRWRDGVQVGSSLTDTSITGLLHTGLKGYKVTTGYVSWDSFQAGDLVAEIEGSGAATSGPASVSGSGDVLVSGSGQVQSGPGQVLGSGDVIISGFGQAQPGSAFVSGSGSVSGGDIEGSGTATSPPAFVSGSGDVVISGSGQIQSSPVSASGEGDVIVSGSGSAQAPPASVSGSGGEPFIPTGEGSELEGRSSTLSSSGGTLSLELNPTSRAIAKTMGLGVLDIASRIPSPINVQGKSLPDAVQLIWTGPTDFTKYNLRIEADGTFTLTFITPEGTQADGTPFSTPSGTSATTTPVDSESTAENLLAALEALPNINPGDVRCILGPLGQDEIGIDFDGQYDTVRVDTLTMDDGGLTNVQVAELQRPPEALPLREGISHFKVEIWQGAYDVGVPIHEDDHVMAEQILFESTDYGVDHLMRVETVAENGQTSTWETAIAAPTPAGTDGSVPSLSPVPLVTGGPGWFGARWGTVANNDDVTYEVHMITETVRAGNPAWVPSALTKAAEVSGTSVFIKLLPDGTPIPYETSYYFKTVAKDDDGLATASSEAGPHQLQQITGSDIAADSIVGNHIAALEILAEHLAAGSVTADKIQTLVLEVAKIFSPALTGKRLEIGDAIFPVRHWDGSVTYFSLSSFGDVYLKGRVDFGLGSGLSASDIIELFEQGGTFATPVRVQPPIVAYTGGLSVTPSYGVATTAGNKLIAICTLEKTGGPGTITPPSGSWVSAGLADDGARRVQVFEYPNAPSMTSTGLWTLNAGYGTVVLLEMANLGTVDRTATNTGTSNAPATGNTAVTQQTHEWLLSALFIATDAADRDPENPTNSFVQVTRGEVVNGPDSYTTMVYDRAVTAAAAYGMSATLPDGVAVWRGLMVTFRAAAATVTPAPANKIKIYAKDKGGVSALYATNDAGTETPLMGSAEHTKEALGTADQGLTTSDVAATGASITLDKNGRWLVMWSCHPNSFTGTFIGRMKVDGVQVGKEVRAWQAAGSVTLHMSTYVTVTAQPDTAIVTVSSTTAGGNNAAHGTSIRAEYKGV